LATSTWYSDRHKIERHILPTLATIPIRRLTVAHREALYDSKLRPAEADVRALAPKTVLEIHLIIRSALNRAVERGILARNVALVAHAPRLRSIPEHGSGAVGYLCSSANGHHVQDPRRVLGLSPSRTRPMGVLGS
jgi:hypothetical protein